MHRREGENRAFGAAVLASIVVHALLLFVFPGLRESQKKPSIVPGPIVARLVQARAAPTPAPVAEEAPKPAAEAPPAPQPVAKPLPVPAAKPAPAAKAAPQAKPSAPVPSAPPPAPAAESAPSAPAAPAAPAAPGPIAKIEPQPSAPAPAVEDAGTLEQYRVALISAAKRYKTNPRVEGMRDIRQARAEVVLVIGANGMIASISIKKSAGHEVLDRNALDTLRKAKPFVQIPPALRGKEFSVEIPFIYELKDEGA